MSLLHFQLVLTAIISTLIASPLVSRLSARVGLVDRPNAEPHKIHKKTVPLAGGIVIAVVLLGISVVTDLVSDQEIRAALAGGCVVLVFGALDDYKPLSPGWKLLGQIFASVILVLLGVRVRIFHWDAVNFIVTFLWIIGVTNAFNFVDSMDGLAAGLAGVAAGLFMIVADESGQPELSLFSAILVGICVITYYFTALPASYFLGDSGAQFLGFVLGAIAIAYNPPGFLPSQSWFIPILLLGVPIFDATLVIISRLRNGKPIYLSGRDHTYHRLVSHGMHPNKAVLTMHLISIVLGCLAFIALSLPPLLANTVFGVVLLAGLVSLIYLEQWKLKS